jgi:hypothetical protein
MTDLTVLVSPIPLYPETRDFTFGRRQKPTQPRPIMVTLETEIEEADSAQNSPIDKPIDTDFINTPTSPPRRPRTPRVVEPHLLSPPVNTWKSRPRHRPTRSHSAPPERRSPTPDTEEQPQREPARFNTEALGFRQRNPNRSFTSFSTVDRNTTRGGELVRPPPPLRKSQFILFLNPRLHKDSFQYDLRPFGGRHVDPALQVHPIHQHPTSSGVQPTSLLDSHLTLLSTI